MKAYTSDDYSANDEYYDGEIDGVKRSNLTVESMTMNGSTPLDTKNTQGKEVQLQEKVRKVQDLN